MDPIVPHIPPQQCATCGTQGVQQINTEPPIVQLCQLCKGLGADRVVQLEPSHSGEHYLALTANGRMFRYVTKGDQEGWQAIVPKMSESPPTKS